MMAKKRKMNQEIHEEETVAWINSMEQRIKVAGSHGPKHEEHLIYRVHSDLREGNERCYEPIVISIGPYHHAKEHLLDMETHKERYVFDLLKRNKNLRFVDLVNMMNGKEQQVRGCYPGKIELTSSNAFVEMMLFDGCFIVELLLKIKDGKPVDDLFVGPKWRGANIIDHDLLLLENQLPFFLLIEIFRFVMPDQMPLVLVNICLKFLKRINLTQTLNEETLRIAPPSIHHLLHLWHKLLIQFPAEQPQDSNEETLPIAPLFVHHLLHLWHKLLIQFPAEQPQDSKEQEPVWMPGITQLEEAGVKFKASSSNLLDIKFRNGQMIIPKIYVHDGTETLLRNLIAFEQCSLRSFPDFYFTCYASFLDFLINTSNDVEILHDKGILTSWLGEAKEVARMFSKLVKGAVITLDQSYLANAFMRVNEYRSRKIPRWRASLVRDYFHSPWTVLSLLGAIVGLSLTAIETVYTVREHK